MQKKEFDELQRHINIANIAFQLSLEILDKKGNELYCVCPFCGYRTINKKADMKLNIIKNSYHCFNCR